MPSDPIATLSTTLGQFAADFATTLSSHADAADGSPAQQDALSDAYTADWPARPPRAVFMTILLAAISCAEQLSVAALALTQPGTVYSAYTLCRGAMDTGAKGCYLAERGLEPLERLRRYFNLDLLALHEDARMCRHIGGAEALARADKHDARAAAIGRAGRAAGLPFTNATDRRQAYLGPGTAGVMTMLDSCANPPNTALSGTYQMLSSVAHGLWNGHDLLITPADGALPGTKPMTLNPDAVEMARQLLGAPVCAAVLARRTCAYLGWESRLLESSVVSMLTNWRRIANTFAGIPDNQGAPDSV